MKKYDELLEKNHALEIENITLKSKIESLEREIELLKQFNTQLTALKQPVAPAPVQAAPVVPFTSKPKNSGVDVEKFELDREPVIMTRDGVPTKVYNIKFRYKKVDYYGGYYDEMDKRHGCWGWCFVKPQNPKLPNLNFSTEENRPAYASLCKKCREYVGVPTEKTTTVSYDDTALPFT